MSGPPPDIDPRYPVYHWNFYGDEPEEGSLCCGEVAFMLNVKPVLGMVMSPSMVVPPEGERAPLTGEPMICQTCAALIGSMMNLSILPPDREVKR